MSFDLGSGVPFHRQLYEAYRTAIVEGVLRAGERLPSSRALARELGISRLPVVTAYEQLRHQGYLEGRSGSGTFVADGIPDVVGPTRRRRGEATATATATDHDCDRTCWPEIRLAARPFQSGLPALDQFPARVWSRLLRRHVRSDRTDLLGYGDPRGLEALRGVIANHLRTTRAVLCETSQVLITSGSQMAIQVAGLALHQPGDIACVEEPGYPSARYALQLAGYHVVPVPVDEAGIDVRRLDRIPGGCASCS